MTSKEINLSGGGALEMGRVAYQWTKKVSGHFNELKPKSLSKILVTFK
jgi:hypothetical protein